MILNEYPRDIIDKYNEYIEKAVRNSLQDSLQETREIAKKCVSIYEEKYPEFAEKLLLSLDLSVIKSLKGTKIQESLRPKTFNSSEVSESVKSKSPVSIKKTKTDNPKHIPPETDIEDQKNLEKVKFLQEEIQSNSNNEPNTLIGLEQPIFDKNNCKLKRYKVIIE